MTTATQSLSNLNCEVHALFVEDGRCTCSTEPKPVREITPVKAGPKRPKQRYTIMSNANCHYFYIPTDREAEFEAWEASLRGGEAYTGEDFTEYRLGGAICTAMFSSSLAN
jgi:hypothetical protein